tara:strand:- start:18642 stop:19481 length:840 start_codon:yes stop_codon:yes gene_type:complete
MKTVTSISGGQSSAYVAVNYPSDFNVFSLVRLEDKKCQFPDKKMRQLVEDRIQKPFIGTAEDDMIIYTILDLEQHLGKKIDWVSGITFEEVIRTRGGWLPNKLHRYCTTAMKIEPMFYWWAEHIGEPVEMQIGYRANETRRAIRMSDKLNQNGLLEMKATFEKHPNGRNKWEMIEWQKPVFPMIEDSIYRDHVVEFFRNKTIRFAKKNNCVHCFHQNPMLLKLRSMDHPNKMKWAARQEGGKNGFWRSDLSYKTIMQHNPQGVIDYDEFSDCDSGFCGI